MLLIHYLLENKRTIPVTNSFTFTMKAVLALLALALVAYAQEDSQCVTVQPVPSFKYEQFEGKWYEIGYIRNEGAASFEDGCFCSYSNVTKNELSEQEGDSLYSYVCNLDEPEGLQSVFDTLLVEMNPAGKWEQDVLGGGFSAHSFTVLDLTADYALTYRCGDYLIADSYTIQVLSRKPSLDNEIVQKMLARVTELKLNPENANYVQVPHNATCAYEQF